jgi:hypothetical protein
MQATPKTPVWFLLSRHWLSLTGVALAITSAASLFFLSPHEMRGHPDNPYLGIILFFVLPALFIGGLLLIAAGVYLSRHKIRGGLAATPGDRKAALRRLALFAAVTTAVNILIGTQVTYRAVAYMETPQFCGATCHTMLPEYTAYANSPHSRVECVECHVAPGAKGWVESKANGTRQLIQTILRTEPKPVPSALTSGRLVPARETCENCHWPEKFDGVRLRVISKFASDEANTRSETVLALMVGGNRFAGIHGVHMGPGIVIRYASVDAGRQTISRVEYRNQASGKSEIYSASDPPSSSQPVTHDMQCVDCHNRPTHAFDLPERAMDKAMAAGEIPATLPFLKKEGVAALQTEYRTREEAARRIPETIIGFYRANDPEFQAHQAEVEGAARGVLAIYNRNVFPDLKVNWGTYPNNLGHTDSSGCFRCHDGAHTAADGNAITQDCSSCHEILAMDEASPAILKTLGVADRLAKFTK